VGWREDGKEVGGEGTREEHPKSQWAWGEIMKDMKQHEKSQWAEGEIQMGRKEQAARVKRREAVQ
jgi:hypothetical protein